MSAQATASPASLRLLVGRFDPEAFDAPRGTARVRLRCQGEGEWDAVLDGGGVRLEPPAGPEADALLAADAGTWRRIASDLGGGMRAWRDGRLHIRRNLHLGVGFLAATSGVSNGAGLRFDTIRISKAQISTLEAGRGPVVVALHGLGGTKASFLPTLALMREHYRVIAVDLPGFGDSVKPLRAPFDAPYFARVMTSVLDALGLERAHLVGNSMGGRIALEMALTASDRVDRLVLLSPAMAWLRPRRWAPVVKLLRPELTMVPMPVEGLVRRLVPKRAWADEDAFRADLAAAPAETVRIFAHR